MGSLSLLHWLIVLIVVFLLFGSSRLPGIVRGFGEGIRAFKQGLNGNPEETKVEIQRLEDKANHKPESKT